MESEQIDLETFANKVFAHAHGMPAESVTQEGDAGQAELAPSETPIGLDPSGLWGGSSAGWGRQTLSCWTAGRSSTDAQIFQYVDSSAKALVNAVVIVNFDATGL
jgi:hypothetical protein